MATRQPGEDRPSTGVHVAMAAVALVAASATLLRFRDHRSAEDAFLFAAAFGTALAAGAVLGRWRLGRGRDPDDVGLLSLGVGTTAFGGLLLVGTRPELFPDASFTIGMVVAVAVHFGFAWIAPVLAWLAVRFVRASLARSARASELGSARRRWAWRALSSVGFAFAVVLVAFTLASVTALVGIGSATASPPVSP